MIRIRKYHVYILECTSSSGKKTFYTGYTKSIEERIKQHAEGRGARYTRGKKIKLLFYQSFNTRSEAMRRERDIKKLSRKEKKELIKSEINLFAIESLEK
ncbi:MAG: GIY-YIG nuclease family protein [Candidatus Helarchaeota archaeon]